jgi:hypothetical protein
LDLFLNLNDTRAMQRSHGLFQLIARADDLNFRHWNEHGESPVRYDS